MTVEEKLRALKSHHPIESWKFDSRDLSWWKELILSKEKAIFLEDGMGETTQRAVEIIREAPAALCLVSEISYVRDCKKWLIENDNT